MSNSNEWELFGFDLRQLGRLFGRAWDEVFWAYQSPVRKAIDTPVTVSVLVDKPLLKQGADTKQAQALKLPESHVLIRQLRLPRAALPSLNQIASAEVADASPFLPDDTVVGQRVDNEDGKTWVLTLAIASRSAIMGLLHNVNPELNADDYEIWAESEGKELVLEGFAETRRDIHYKKRLLSLGSYGAVALLTLVFAMALPWVYQSYRYHAVEDLLEQSRHDARRAMGLRNELVQSNTQLHSLQQYIDTSAKPLLPLVGLSADIKDDAWLGSYEQAKNKVVIDGYADNAAALIQQLTVSDKFSGVKPLSAIRKVGRNQVERFRLELILPDLQDNKP